MEETKSRIEQQEVFNKTVINYLVKPFYLLVSRFVYKEAKVTGLRNIDEMKQNKYNVIVYNHMFDFDIVEIIYRLLQRDVFVANVAKHEFFNHEKPFEKLLCWLMENSGAFPVYLDYNRKTAEDNRENTKYTRGKGSLSRDKLDNFFKQFYAYLRLGKPVTIAINGSITRDKKFPKPEEGLAFLLMNAEEKASIPINEINIFPVGNAFIGDLEEYNRILFNRKEYPSTLYRNYLALKKLVNKISIFLSFGKPFTMIDVLGDTQGLSSKQIRGKLSNGIMEKIKSEVRNAWETFDVEKKYNLTIEKYLTS